MNTNDDLTPPLNTPDDDLPLESGAEHLGVPPVTDPSADGVPDDAVDDRADDDAFSYEQFSSDLSSLFPEQQSGFEVDTALAALESSAPSAPAAPITFAPPKYTPKLPTPTPITLRRGSPLSVIPALILIGAGAWLTLQTTSGAPLDGLLLAGIAAGGIVVTLIFAWLATGRWSRGLLFTALLLAAVTGILAAGIIPGGIDLTRAYPLFAVGIGAAILFSGLLARPVDGRIALLGLITAAAGGIGMIVTSGMLDSAVLGSVASAWPIVLVIIAALWLAPLVFRRRAR